MVSPVKIGYKTLVVLMRSRGVEGYPSTPVVAAHDPVVSVVEDGHGVSSECLVKHLTGGPYPSCERDT